MGAEDFSRSAWQQRHKQANNYTNNYTSNNQAAGPNDAGAYTRNAWQNPYQASGSSTRPSVQQQAARGSRAAQGSTSRYRTAGGTSTRTPREAYSRGAQGGSARETRSTREAYSRGIQHGQNGDGTQRYQTAPSSTQRYQARQNGFAERAQAGLATAGQALLSFGDTASEALSQLPHMPEISRRTFLVGAGVVAALVVGGVSWASCSPISISINGRDVSIGRNENISQAFASAGSPAKAGNLLDVEGDVLQEGGGDLFSVSADGQAIPYADASTLKAADYKELSFSDGADVEEDATVHESTALPFKTVDEGTGSLHIMTQAGEEGLKTTKTGNISGKTVTGKVDKEPQDRVFSRCWADVGDEKVVALTFDDGPWDQTAELLDILKENDAHVTFFCVGDRICDDKVAVVKREDEEGHQVATHTYDHALGSGQSVNLALMTKDEQRTEVEKGFEAIASAIGHEPSHVMRAPGGNFPTEVWENVCDLIDADVRWDVDTQDWSKPGSEAIVESLMGITPGDIVLMHDGGGDRSQTIEAVRTALPKLKEAGWKFITIDELRQYPTKG